MDLLLVVVSLNENEKYITSEKERKKTEKLTEKVKKEKKKTD
jgi:hypothetical protein